MELHNKIKELKSDKMKAFEMTGLSLMGIGEVKAQTSNTVGTNNGNHP